MAALSDDHFDGVLLHEVLHAALLHVTRRSQRDPQRWNIAADIVVNGILIEQGFSLPEGHVRNLELERLAVEEVYALLLQEPQESVVLDLLEAPPEDAQEAQPRDGEADKGSLAGRGKPTRKRVEGGALGEAEKAAIERHWKKPSSRPRRWFVAWARAACRRVWSGLLASWNPRSSTGKPCSGAFWCTPPPTLRATTAATWGAACTSRPSRARA